MDTQMSGFSDPPLLRSLHKKYTVSSQIQLIQELNSPASCCLPSALFCLASLVPPPFIGVILLYSLDTSTSLVHSKVQLRYL